MAKASRAIWRLVASLIAALVVLAGAAGPAQAAAERLQNYAVTATIAEDGSLSVQATIGFDGVAPDSLSQEFATVVRTAERTEYRFEISDVTVTSAGRPLPAQISEGAVSTTVTMPTAGLTEAVELDYRVRGVALATADDTTTVVWGLLQGLELPVAVFDAEVAVPGLFTMVDCAAGDPASPGACTYYSGGTHDSPKPVFHHEGAGPGDVVVATVRFPRATVAVDQDLREVWSLDRAFSAAPLPLGVAAGLLLLGGLALWAAHARIGRDADAALAPAPVLVAAFAPIGAGESEFQVQHGVRPGEVGTLVDERVDPVDITATLLDLAVRGHLQITELPLDNTHAATEWTFARLGDGSDHLLDYERRLLDAVAPLQGEPVKVSNLAGSVGAVIEQIQSELYDEVVERGWFAHRPDATRNRWATVGWIGLAAAVGGTVLLAANTRFGLAGLALIAVALGVLFVAQEMPARTASGTAILAGLDALRGALATQPVDQVISGRGVAGISPVLPYAIVLGGSPRWLEALAAANHGASVAELTWYRGPEDWHLDDLAASLANFITTVQGTLFTR